MTPETPTKTAPEPPENGDLNALLDTLDAGADLDSLLDTLPNAADLDALLDSLATLPTEPPLP
jgi:hypothetical protein